MASKKDSTTTEVFTEAWNEIISNTNEKLANVLKTPDISICMMLFLIVIMVLIVLVFFLHQLYIQTKDLRVNDIIAVWNSSNLLKEQNSQDVSKFYTQCKYVFVTIFVLFMSILSILMLNNRKNRKLIMGVIFMVFILLFVVIFFYNNESTNSSKIYTYIMNKIFIIFSVLIVIVALALVYKLFANKLRNQPGNIGLFIDFIFFIPCLFSDVLELIMKEINMTPNSVFVLFIIEILLIISYFTIPIAITSSITKKSIPILKDYKFLDNSTILATDILPQIVIQDTNTNLKTKSPNRKYSVSLWVYLNQQQHNDSTSMKNIFSYGSEAKGMKPQIMYSNSSTNQKMKDLYQITLSGFSDPTNNKNNKNTNIYLELSGQKWNHFVFNYFVDTSIAELFVNGELVRVYNFDSEHPYPEYDESDLFSIGDNNGLDGAVCNIAYYDDTLTTTQVHMLYKLLANKNPPTLQ
jgi:hypothetical protein